METPRDWPICVAGAWRSAGRGHDVTAPWNGAVVGRTWLADEADYEAGVAGAIAAAPAMAALTTYERAAILRRVSSALAAGRDAIARVLAAEAGKPLRDARVEVDRATLTFAVAADETTRLAGEAGPLDLAPHGRGRFAITRRVPVGPIAGISPFNFPLNLVAHKLAPAIGAGNPIVLKPATRTPLSALTLGRLLVEAGVPDGGISVLPMDRTLGDRLVTDDRFRLLTFTGSSPVGWDLKARAGRKRVVLELGGNAGAIVDRCADLDHTVRRLIAGGFAYAGQSCISVQRVVVLDEVYDAVRDRLAAGVGRLVVGDPMDEATDVGPMIGEGDADRIEGWIRDAVAAGAAIVTGGRRLGAAVFEPTVLADVPETAAVCAEEAFAPVVVLSRARTFEEALAAVNRSRFGLQAGVFTNSLAHAWMAFDRLEVGGVIVNDVPSYRLDAMPYGGVKDSGLGREGPRFAMEDMTELRLLVVNQDRS